MPHLTDITAMTSPNIKTIFFDLMGTCLDWHSSILPYLPTNHTNLPASTISPFALSWRQGFFNEIQARLERGDAHEDIDVTHRRVLDRLLLDRGAERTEREREDAVEAWHFMRGLLTYRSHL